MAKWRAIATEQFPELRRVIAKAENIMAFWIELVPMFEKAYEKQPPDENIIARVYRFADWCAQSPRNSDAEHDTFTAVAVAFYEHIPKFRPARDDMPRWFRYSEVAQSKQIFAYLIGEESFDKLLEYLKKNQHRYQARKKPADGID